MKNILFMLLAGWMVATPALAVQTTAGDTLNLAVKASVTTSFVSSWEKLAAVNDGLVPANSSTKSVIAYGNWSGDAALKTYNWVQYEWPRAQRILSTSVFWWSDGGGISQPTNAYITYWNGITWVKFGNIGCQLNVFNSTNLNILTDKLRIYMVSNSSTGIFEWKATGVESGICTPSVVTPFVKTGDNDPIQANTAHIVMGDSVLFNPLAEENGSWGWSGPNGFFAYSRQLVLKNVQPAQAGTYTACYTNECGAYTQQYYHLTVDSIADVGAAYTWPKYSPTLNYNFRDEFPTLAMPTKDLNDCSNVVGTISSGWWTFKWGPGKKSVIDSVCVLPLLDRLNKEFAYFRDTLGWPPDLRVQKGYRSAVYLYGSGLCTDNMDSTALGGWQSSISYNGVSYPMIIASYYPIYSFSPKVNFSDEKYQQDGMVHEGIHCVLASLPGCKSADWLQEGGNTWLQQEADSKRSGNYSSMGYLNAGSLIAPFMPIECYRGWLLDDSFGGPASEGVAVYNGTTQLCNWRNLLGGVQYSNIFPTFLGMTLGSGSLAWIWRNCPIRVLEGMAAKLGDRAVRRLITEYHAKQATLDMGNWTNAMKKLMDDFFGTTIKAETSPAFKTPASWYASPYVVTTKSASGLITPEFRTTPGWSGANQIPLSIIGNEVTVNFQPLAPNMTCQLCYRTRTGSIVYSNVVNGGDCTLKLPSQPANNVVIAVICNTDYIYEGDTTRKKHFDYRLQLVKGVTSVASRTNKWYDWNKVYVSIDQATAKGSNVLKFKNPIQKGEPLSLLFEQSLTEPAVLSIRNLYGQLIFEQSLNDNTTIKESLNQGVYLITLRSAGREETQKLIVN